MPTAPARTLKQHLAEVSIAPEPQELMLNEQSDGNEPQAPALVSSIAESVTEMLRLWYGLLTPPTLRTQPAQEDSRLSEQLGQVLGYVIPDAVSKELLAGIRELVHILSQRTPNTVTLRSLVDFVPESIHPHPRHLPGRAYKITMAYAPDGSQWYLINSLTPCPPEKHVYWLLAVSDSRVANMVLRWNQPLAIKELAAWLFQFGVAMKTLHRSTVCHAALPVAPPFPIFTGSSRPLGLGARKTNDNFSTADYNAYVTQRNELLRSGWGRAALLKGGIVWRIARLVLTEDDLLSGPSGNHTQRDHLQLDTAGYIDDELGEHELDVICGVYRCLSGT